MQRCAPAADGLAPRGLRKDAAAAAARGERSVGGAAGASSSGGGGAPGSPVASASATPRSQPFREVRSFRVRVSDDDGDGAAPAADAGAANEDEQLQRPLLRGARGGVRR